VHFDLTEDDRALVDAVRKVCAGGASWDALTEAGVFDLREAGLGWTEAVLVFEELGRALVPGPLVGTHLASGLVEGLVGVLEADLSPLFVEHLDILDALVVILPDEMTVVDPATVDAAPVPNPLDPATPLHRLASTPEGERLLDDVEQWRRHGALLTAALLAGIAQEVTDMAVHHAQQREQFGKPIGAFQAVKHLCADMHVRAEVLRAAVHAAGVIADDPHAGDLGRAVAGAQQLAGKSAIANAKACIQVHGGMGYTWEVDAHRYLKRAVVLSTHYPLS
jgi:alkylation response protein AidB-like acyl-CoA dehydrogenase